MKTFKQYIEGIIDQAHELPDLPCDDVQKIIVNKDEPFPHFDLRFDFAKKFSWSVLCKEAVDLIKRYARPPLFDVMAGTGYWAKELTQRGIPTISSDKFLGEKNKYGHNEKYHPIEEKDAVDVLNNIKKLSDKKAETGIHGDVLMAWPPYGEKIGEHIVSKMPIGSRLFYVGEGSGGATGTDRMHKLLGDNTKFKKLDTLYLPRFVGIHDTLFVYERVG
jgi:hypothetical protein